MYRGRLLPELPPPTANMDALAPFEPSHSASKLFAKLKDLPNSQEAVDVVLHVHEIQQALATRPLAAATPQPSAAKSASAPSTAAKSASVATPAKQTPKQKPSAQKTTPSKQSKADPAATAAMAEATPTSKAARDVAAAEFPAPSKAGSATNACASVAASEPASAAAAKDIITQGSVSAATPPGLANNQLRKAEGGSAEASASVSFKDELKRILLAYPKTRQLLGKLARPTDAMDSCTPLFALNRYVSQHKLNLNMTDGPYNSEGGVSKEEQVRAEVAVMSADKSVVQTKVTGKCV